MTGPDVLLALCIHPVDVPNNGVQRVFGFRMHNCSFSFESLLGNNMYTYVPYAAVSS